MRPPRIWLKLFRDVGHSRGQFLAAAIVIGFGVAIFIGAYGSYLDLSSSYDRTYDQLKMADLWFGLSDAPHTVVDAVRDVPGVAAAEARLVVDLPVEPSAKSPNRAIGRFVSLPDSSAGHATVSDVKLTSGVYPTGPGQVLLERSFADFNHIATGSSITVLTDGTPVPLRVVGTAVSPEYLWVARSAQDWFTVPSAFGVIFMRCSDLASLAGRAGRIDDVAVRLTQPAARSGVIAQVSHILSAYGTVQVMDRQHQVSNQLLRLDLDGFQTIALVFPILFLSVSALAVYSLLSRLVEGQRRQIGVLRAMGYERRQILVHYAAYGALIGLTGGLFGVGLGFGLSILLTKAYAAGLHIPFIAVQANLPTIAISFACGVAACLLAAVVPARAAAAISPAEAMRGPSPVRGRQPLLETLVPPIRRLPLVLKLPIRNLFRWPRRTLFGALGVAAGVALTLVAWSFLDSYNRAVNIQFDQIQRYDARLNFASSFPSLAEQVSRMPGVTAAEAISEMPVRLVHDGETHDLILDGVPNASALLRSYTPSGGPISPGGGLLLTSPTASQLGVHIGDSLSIESLGGAPTGIVLRVSGIIRHPLGDVVMADRSSVQALAGGDRATALLLSFAGGTPNAELRSALLALPGAGDLELKSDLRRYVHQDSELFLLFVVIMLAFSVALGFAIIFNSTLMGVIERRRELATMRTVGMGVGRLAVMVGVENVLTGILGFVIGLPAGYILARYFTSLYQNDILDMPFVIGLLTYFAAGAGALLVLLLAEVPAIRFLRRLDLAGMVREVAD